MPADNYCTAKLRNTAMKIGLVLATIALLAASSSPGTAEPLRLVGATTFTAEVMVPHQAEIEAISGQKIILLPNRSSLGVYGLFEGHHIAMVSTSLPNLINDLRKERPDLAYDKLRVFNIATTRAAFSIHPSNPIRFADSNTMRRVLTGGVTNWSQLGWQELPIKLVLVQTGGGVQASIEAELGIKISVKDPIRVQISSQVNKIVEQEPAALGLAQIENLRQRKVVELTTDRVIEQQLNMVTLEEPSPAALSVIEAVKMIVAKAGPRSTTTQRPSEGE